MSISWNAVHCTRMPVRISGSQFYFYSLGTGKPCTSFLHSSLILRSHKWQSGAVASVSSFSVAKQMRLVCSMREGHRLWWIGEKSRHPSRASHSHSSCRLVFVWNTRVLLWFSVRLGTHSIPNTLIKTEYRLWRPVTSYFPNLDVHLLSGVFIPATSPILLDWCSSHTDGNATPTSFIHIW